MGFEQRSYGGKLFRPTPYAQYNAELQLCIIATTWGNAETTNKISQIITDYYQAKKNDIEVTSPFDFLTCLSPLANRLRIAGLLANDHLYREINKDEYLAGVELCLAAKEQDECVVVQIGHPNVFLKRPGASLFPLATNLDFNNDYETTKQNLPPLPHQMIGLDPSAHFAIQSFKHKKGDKLVFVSHSHLHQDFFLLKDNQINLKDITQMLAHKNDTAPFWAGVLEF